ncbi:hypothetical protein Plec18167_001704 [Paecilomyces lecythidis]|uniref:Uncharacterized protein n=1 Tax=Paecilomyces lecythidis TaxID=3004212 RepID=A0ABR3Y9U3_9EURO
MTAAHDYTQGSYSDRSNRESLLNWMEARQIRREKELMEGKYDSQDEESSRDEEETQYEDESKDEEESQDEVEVLYELDENAMAQLPPRLQEHMRQIQMERFSRLSLTDPNLEIRAHSIRKSSNSGKTTNEHSRHLPYAAHDNVHIGTEIGEPLFNPVMRTSSLRARTPWPRRAKPVTAFEERWMHPQEGYQYGDYIVADIGRVVAPLAPQEYHAHTAMTPENYIFVETSRSEVYGENAGGHYHGHGSSASRKKTSRFMSRVRVPIQKAFRTLRRFLKKRS